MLTTQQHIHPADECGIGKGIAAPAKKDMEEKFQRLTGPAWPGAPEVFCPEKNKIDTDLIGRFFGENNIKECALEIFRVSGKIAVRYAWAIKHLERWDQQIEPPGSNRYRYLLVDGSTIGSARGIRFQRQSDGSYDLQYKQFTKLAMVKL